MTLTDFTHDAPMGATNVASFVERTYRESAPWQWVREAGVQNPFEAGATEVRLLTEWQAVDAHGVYRRVIADDGSGICAEDWDGRGHHPLVKFFNEYGGSGKPIGGANDNFGIGAKSSLLPWNKFGLVVISHVATDDDPDTMIWVRYNPHANEYGLRPFETENGYETVIVPSWDDEMGIDWSLVVPEFVKETGHGLTLVLLGDSPDQDTVLGDINRIEKAGVPGKQETRYITSRYWNLPLDVGVDHYTTTDKTKWPTNPSEYKRNHKVVYFNRSVKSCRDFVYNYLPKDVAVRGEITHDGVVTLSDGTEILWALWGGPGDDYGRGAIEYYEWKKGFVAALYEDELYERQNPQTWRNWGISETNVRERLWLLVRPPMADAKGKDGVYPVSDRTQLRIQGTKGNRLAGDPLPWADWAFDFSQMIPGPILEALSQARVDRGPTDVNMSEEMKQKLITRFAHRWRRTGFIAKLLGNKTITPTFPTKISGVKPGMKGLRRGGPGNGKGHGIHSLNPKPNASWNESANGEKANPTSLSSSLPEVDWRLPRYPSETRKGPKVHDFELGQGAEWIPPNSANPHGLIVMNEEHPVVQEQLEYWTSEYTEDDADEIRGVVLGTFGMLMIANVAHGEHLKTTLARAEMLNDELRNPWALTATMLGVIQQHAMIAPVVGGKLKKKVTT